MTDLERAAHIDEYANPSACVGKKIQHVRAIMIVDYGNGQDAVLNRAKLMGVVETLHTALMRHLEDHVVPLGAGTKTLVALNISYEKPDKAA